MTTSSTEMKQPPQLFVGRLFSTVYPYTVSITGFYDLPEYLQKMQPVFRYGLVNLMRQEEEELKKYKVLTRFVIESLNVSKL